MSARELTPKQVDDMSKYLHSLAGHIDHCPDVRESYGEDAERLMTEAQQAAQPFDDVRDLDFPLVNEEDIERALPLLKETYNVFEGHCYNNCPPDERNARDEALRGFIDEMANLSNEQHITR